MTERAKSSHEPASAKESIVFVIDDDVAVRTTLSSLFRSVGLRVELFGSAHEFAQIKMLWLAGISYGPVDWLATGRTYPSNIAWVAYMSAAS